MSAADVVAQRVKRFGPLRFDAVVDIALYDPAEGFYSAGRGAGRGADFITSPEVGPLFGAVVARALDSWWTGIERPDPFVVIEAGAGSGALARAVLGAEPACSPALRYVLVERSPLWRAKLKASFPVEPATSALARHEGRGAGPLVTVLGELPAGDLDGIVVANELLDNLAFRLLERQADGDGWLELYVDEDLAEVLVPASPADSARASRFAPLAPAASRIPLQDQAAGWLRSALGCLARGRVVAFDYVDATPSLAVRPWRDWVRTYRGHARGVAPLAHLGEQDITCEVAADQLAQVRHPIADRPQSEFLSAHGLEELRVAAQSAWEARAAIGDLEALRSKSRMTEAAALSDPAGLGAFRALEWEV